MKTLVTPRHKALVKLLRDERVARRLLQGEIARRLGEHQSLISRIESGQRRIDLIEFFVLADAIGFDPVGALRKLQSGP